MVEHYQPTSLQEALKIRSENRVTPYAGGTDLMIEGNENANYLFLNKVCEMRRIYEDSEFIHIGATCTYEKILSSELVPQILKEAISQIAAPAIRNLGTMGGNIGNGSAKADSALVCFALDAKLQLSSVSRTRLVDIDKFYLGRKKLDLADNELITEILIPKADFGKYSYFKVGARNALAISRVSFAGVFALKDERIFNIACAFGAVADTVLRFKDIEKMFIGKIIEEASSLKQDFVSAYSESIVPIRGRVSMEYRKAVCMNLLGEFLSQSGI